MSKRGQNEGSIYQLADGRWRAPISLGHKVDEKGKNQALDVKVGDAVTKGQTIGRTGTTGLAGGDHLHFTMLVDGRPVNPVEWWDPHWIQDRVDRKLHELGGAAPSRVELPVDRSAHPAAKHARARRGTRL